MILMFHLKVILMQIPVYDFDCQHQQKDKEPCDIYLFLMYCLLQLYHDNVDINLVV
jgi:hypothetical protein